MADSTEHPSDRLGEYVSYCYCPACQREYKFEEIAYADGLCAILATQLASMSRENRLAVTKNDKYEPVFPTEKAVRAYNELLLKRQGVFSRGWTWLNKIFTRFIEL